MAHPNDFIPTGPWTTVPRGVRLAKSILAGDVDYARRLARCSYTVAESRAIVGACRVANEKFGTSLTLAEFIKS